MRVWELLILDVLIAEVITLSKMDMTNCLESPSMLRAA